MLCKCESWCFCVLSYGRVLNALCRRWVRVWLWVLMTAFLPPLHRVPSGQPTGLDSWACLVGKALGGRRPLPQSFLNLCSQDPCWKNDPCWKDDPQASLQGCFLLGTRLGSGLQSAQGPWVASGEKGTWLGTRNGHARPLVAAMENALPVPQGFLTV